MVEPQFEHWDRLLFRDYLRHRPEVAEEYGRLKQRLSADFHDNRVAYTEAKGDFIRQVTETARQCYGRPAIAVSRTGAGSDG